MTPEQNQPINDIPEKFKDPETGEVKLDLLLKSYRELERRLSNLPQAPKNPGRISYSMRSRHV